MILKIVSDICYHKMDILKIAAGGRIKNGYEDNLGFPNTIRIFCIDYNIERKKDFIEKIFFPDLIYGFLHCYVIVKMIRRELLIKIKA